MKFKNIIWGMVVLTCLCGCEKEDRLYPRSTEMVLRFDFPEGDASRDKELEKIAEEFTTIPVYKSFDTTDLNRSWTMPSLVGGVTRGDILEGETADFYVDFVKNHIFAFLKPEIVNGMLPNYILLVNNLRTPGSGGYYATFAKWDGMDFWAFCLNCDALPDLAPWTKPFKQPKTAWEYKVSRGKILQNIITKIVEKGKITVPEVFSNDFDYSTQIKSADAFVNDPNYYKTRGFPGKMLATSFEKFSTHTEIKFVTPEINFISYMHLGMRYTRDSVLLLYPEKKFPKIIQYYDFTVKYVKDNYDWDLTLMEKLPVIKED